MMIELLFNEFYSKVSQIIIKTVDSFAEELTNSRIPVYKTKSGFLANFGDKCLAVDYSLMDCDSVDASTIERVFAAFGCSERCYFVAFAKSFADSSYSLAKRGKLALAAIKTLTIYFPSGDFIIINNLFDKLKEHGVPFRKIHDPSLLVEEAFLSQGLYTAINWLVKYENFFLPDIRLRSLNSLLDSPDFWINETKMYGPLKELFEFLGFTLLDVVGGEFADLYIIRPVKILVEVKNEKAGKNAVEQVVEYRERWKEIDARLSVKVGGPWMAMVIAPEFSKQAEEEAKKKKVVLLDREGLESFIELYSVRPPSVFSLIRLFKEGGIVTSLLREELETLNLKLKIAREVIKYLRASPRARIEQIIAAVSNSLGISRQKVSEAVDFLSKFVNLVDEYSGLFVSSEFSLIHFVRLYKMLSG